MSEETEIILTDEQKKNLVNFWNLRRTNPPSLSEMTQINFPDKDGRSVEAKATKKALSELKIKGLKSAYYKKDEITLTDGQKEIIKKNGEFNELELARTIFQKPDLEAESSEVKVVKAYINSINPPPSPDTPNLKKYYAPKNFQETFGRINRYAIHKMDFQKLTPQQKREIEITKAFLGSMRFQYTINSYEAQEQRDLFENEFINFVYNKPDLSSEETEQVINLCLDIVDLSDTTRRRNLLNGLFDQTAMESDGARASKSIGDMIADLNKEINDNKSRQDKIIKSLTGTRNERMRLRVAERASMVSLIEGWKSEEHRERIIKFAQSKDAKIKETLTELDSMNAIKASIFGISPEEIV